MPLGLLSGVVNALGLRIYSSRHAKGVHVQGSRSDLGNTSFSTNPVELLHQVVQDLMTPDHDLNYILRRCEFACGLLDWNEQAAWFSRELSGYSAEDQLPDYRIVPARLVWVASELQSAYERLTVTSEQVNR